MMRRLLLTAFALLSAAPAAAQEMPIFDAHIHYSHDAVKLVPPQEAAEILRKAGVRKALVSSSDDDGTQKLLAAAPDIVVPSLRPYRSRADVGTWVRDPTVIAYLEERLARFKYVAIGEFHAYGPDVDTPVMQRVIALARERGLLLHAHSDADAVERIFKAYPDALVLWAHSGFDPPDKVIEVLKRHKNLWCDLAFRTEQASGGVVTPAWRAAFEAFPDRFMVGTDTFTPERWHYVGEHARYSREWLGTLPPVLGRAIGYDNAAKMLERVPAAQKLREGARF